jgi:signal transduction histidine kinase
MSAVDAGPTEPPVNILLVDDVAANLLALEAILEGLKQILVRASSGTQALARLADDDFAVILLDINMPDLDGFAAAKQIRARERSRHTPIIFLTAHDSAEFPLIEAYKLGAVDYLIKPLSPDILRAKVAVFVELFQKARQIQRQAERLRQIERQEFDQQKDAFLMMLAHELRNPLAPVVTSVRLLQQSGDDPNVRTRALDTIGRQMRHMGRLIDGLLETTRLVRGQVRLERERLDLARIVRTTTEDRRLTLEDSGLTVALQTPETPVWVAGDATRLTQVLDNLLDNARKYTERGGKVGVIVSADAEAREAIVTVTDSGSGIEPSVLPYLFSVFVQADRSLARTGGGLGLGLFVVRSLVELHGGRVEARSTGPGHGATFTVRLPLEPEPPALTVSLTLPSAGRSSRVLIVEDNRDAASSLSLLLEVLGHNVRVAHTGPEGVRLASEWRPEVVVSDIGLPGIDGYEVARRILREPGLEKTVLVALTGYGGEDDKRRAREAGFRHFLVKPADPDALQRVLNGAIA